MTTPVQGLPVGSVSVSGSDITVSALLNNPRLIEQRVAELANLEYWADKILPNVGGAPAGVIIYQQWNPVFSTLDRVPEPLAPDSEVPLAGTVEQDLSIVAVETDGLGYSITREQELRNQRFVIDRKDRGLANSIAMKFNARAVAAITGSISTNSRTLAGTDWSALVTEGADPDPKSSWPHSTIQLVNARQLENRYPFRFDGLLAHPLDVWRLGTIYQLDSNTSLATKLGLSTIVEDNTGDVPHGQPILFSSGNTGGTAWEQPIQTEVIPEPRRRRKVVQSTGSAAFFVDNPYGLLQLTGVAAADISAGLTS